MSICVIKPCILFYWPTKVFLGINKFSMHPYLLHKTRVWLYFTFFHRFSRGSLNWFTGLNGGFIFQPWGFYMWMCIHEASVEYSHMKQARYEEHYTFKKGFPQQPYDLWFTFALKLFCPLFYRHKGMCLRFETDQ